MEITATIENMKKASNDFVLATHSASKRKPPPAPYTAADPPVPPESWTTADTGTKMSGTLTDAQSKRLRDSWRQLYSPLGGVSNVGTLRPDVAISVTDTPHAATMLRGP